MSDRLSQLQDHVNYLASLFCDATGVLQSQANPSKFDGFAENIERNYEANSATTNQEQQDVKQTFVELITNTAKEIDGFIDSLPDENELDEFVQTQNLKRLELENRIAAKQLEQVTNCAEDLLKQIQQRLTEISESELKNHKNTVQTN